MIKYWYNNSPTQQFRTHSRDIINLQLNAAERMPAAFHEECSKAAGEIYSDYPSINLALSAGWESQVCLQSFLRAGVKPKVFIVEFPYKLNTFDSYFAKEACKAAGIIPTIFTINLKEFSEKLSKHYAEKYQTYSIMESILADCAEKVEGDTLVVDKIELRRDVNPNGRWSFVRNEDFNMWPSRFNSVNRDRKIINEFFTSSPEIMLSFLTLPEVVELVTNDKNGKISLNSSKKSIYNSAGFNKEPDAGKTLSIINIKKLAAETANSIESALPFRPRSTYIEYNELLTALTTQETTWQFV
jgi:hypothetical protein